MAKDKSFQRKLSTTVLFGGTLLVAVAVVITFPRARATYVALAEKFAAHDVIVKHTVSAKVGRVGTDVPKSAPMTRTATETAANSFALGAAMARKKKGEEKVECATCRELRVKSNQKPRMLVRLPTAISQSDEFKKPGRDILVCEWCDGETLISNALRTHEDRRSS